MARLSLRNRLERWVLLKLVVQGFWKLEAAHLGQQLDALLDEHYGERDSERMQQSLVRWLKAIIAELEAEHDTPPAA